jgi:hypothetical protein
MGKGSWDWVWRVLILIVVALFVAGFYFLLSEDSGKSFFDFFHSKDETNRDGSWMNNNATVSADDDDLSELPAPPVLPK